MLPRAQMLFVSALIALVGLTIGAGIYFGHTYVAMAFGVWIVVEILLWRSPAMSQWFWDGGNAEPRWLRRLAEVYIQSQGKLVEELWSRLSEVRYGAPLKSSELQLLEKFRQLVRMKSLVSGVAVPGESRWLRAMTYRKRPFQTTMSFTHMANVDVQQVRQAAGESTHLFIRLRALAKSEHRLMRRIARSLYKEMFQKSYESDNGDAVLERVSDRISHYDGVPFLVLHLLTHGLVDEARFILRALMQENADHELDDSVLSALYWMVELKWFVAEDGPALEDFESSIRYLYHLIFTEPDRAGFLEIDSRFYGQFATVNEMAREGFLYKEVLFEKILALWEDYEGVFDGVFQETLQTLSGRQSKIYDHRGYWVDYWAREQAGFGREYLNIVEGNLCYADGHLQEALRFYELALEENPKLRSALLNIPFCHVGLGDEAALEQSVERIVGDPGLVPSAHFVAGNAYLLMGDSARSEEHYESLRELPAWENKVDYYKSVFCYERGLYEPALYFAEKAHEKNPEHSSFRYHLSLCYNALGNKEKALEVVQKISNGGEANPEWLHYYRFTLERDAGRHAEAKETLLKLPLEYFDDPEELRAAQEFAKLRQDLSLLRHLKRR